MQVVIGLIFEKDYILIARRQQHLFQANKWEFPGGKVEQDESLYNALCRELKEEIGIQVLRATEFMKTEYNYPDRYIDLSVWKVEEFSGVPHGSEGQPVKWVKLSDLSHYEFLAANEVVIAEIAKLMK